MGCGCKGRQDALNRLRPGLGDQVKVLIDKVLGKVRYAFLGE